MIGKQVRFFATFEDLAPVMLVLESATSIKYVKDGLTESPRLEEFRSYFDMPGVGMSKSDTYDAKVTYLIVPANLPVRHQSVPQRKGGEMYKLDETITKEGPFIKFGGIASENLLLSGRLGTIHDNDFIKLIFKLFSKNIKKSSKLSSGFYICSQAETLLKEGWRLTSDENFPREMDVVI